MKRVKPAIYTNRAADAVVQGVECIASHGQHLSFFHVGSDAAAVKLRGWLEASPLNQQIVSQTAQGDRVLVVAQGSLTPGQLVAGLAEHGETLMPPAKDKKFDPWKWRAVTSVVGQGLQIASGRKTVDANGDITKKSQADARSVIGFATLNMAANIMNWIFGAQEKRDPHQLRHLKEQFNAQLAPMVGAENLPTANERCLNQRPAEDTQKTFGQKAYSFMQRYSVTGGEIGLRVLGSAALVLPHPIDGAKALWQTKSITKAFDAAKNPTKTFYVGLAMLTGKFVSLLAKEPDPYNPQAPSMIRSFREKVAFPMSSVIEAGAAGYMGYDKVTKGRIKLGNTIHPDFLNGLGNASFIGGYAIRFNAPYGSLEVEMPELYAHISDGIAKAPRDKIPGLVARTAQGLADHFKGLHTLSELYSGIAADLAKQHGIQLDGKPMVTNETHAAAAAATPTKVHAVEYKDRLVEPSRQLAAAHS